MSLAVIGLQSAAQRVLRGYDTIQILMQSINGKQGWLLARMVVDVEEKYICLIGSFALHV
jgi:hypothetical protein